MPHVLGMPTLQVGDPVALLVLMKADDLPLGHGYDREGAGRTPVPRRSMYVDTGMSVVKPNLA
jgi:hypothetical protein